MKSERRHELEQNALADWMTDLIETLKPYANYILAGTLAVVFGPSRVYHLVERG